MNRLTCITVICALALFGISTTCFAEASSTKTATPPPTKRVTLEALLKAAEIDYIKKDDFYKIPVELDGNTIIVFASENKISEESPDYIVGMYSTIIQLPKDVKPSEAMLKKIAEINETLWVGRIGYDSKENTIDYLSSFWEKNADADTLGLELCFANVTCTDAKKDLTPFLTE